MECLIGCVVVVEKSNIFLWARTKDICAFFVIDLIQIANKSMTMHPSAERTACAIITDEVGKRMRECECKTEILRNIFRLEMN